MVDDALTPRQVAEELGVTVRTVQRWIAAGSLPAQRVGGRLRVSRSSLSASSPAAAPPTGAPSAARTLRRLLIANRGEIARRIARTAHERGLFAIGLHTAEEPSPAGTDASVLVPSYLDAEAIVRAARDAGADAVHPGYGFLSENPAFARAVLAAGMTWVGPPPEAIAAMGDKAAARRLAASHGVPVLPGYDGTDQDDETLLREARRVGLPLLIKPAAGGGGKGMRVIRSSEHLPEGLAAARREAHRSFGDDRLILERLLDAPRHVEIQVLFDAHGDGVHLGERDCSAQRRNQKIVEESPGPSVDADLRRRMGEAALSVARAVGYANAGTVEFLLADDGSFHFLEMNTRLQVEHPVTEAVTGRDLVADQLRIAAGEPLGFGQDEIRFSGHAIEARLYAEEPEAGFLPATGRVLHLRWPDGIRVDAGVSVGDEVTDRFDPMLAKLIARGATRDEALSRLREALQATEVLGVRTNLRFLRWLLDHPAMRGGEVRTDLIDRLELPAPPKPDEGTWHAAAAALLAHGALPDGAWGGAWRANAPPSLRLRSGETERRVSLGPQTSAAIPFAVEAGTGRVHVDVEGQSVEIAVAPAPGVEEAVRHAAAHGEGHAELRAPMPGRVIAVRMREGDDVPAHAPVIVMEAMKMEHSVVAPLAGRLSRLLVAEGQQVERGELLGEVTA